MGLIFYKIICKHGFIFPKFSSPENYEKWTYILRIIPENGCLFLPKSPLKIGRGFDAQTEHPRQNQIQVPPWVILYQGYLSRNGTQI